MHRIPYWRLSGFYFFYFAFIGIFLPYFGLYLKSLSFTAWDISVLMSQMQLMRLFGPYLWGTLADRIGQWVPIVRLACLLALLVSGSFFFIRGFEAFFAAMAVLAFFWSASLPLVETLTFEHLREASERYSRIRIWGSIGFIVSVMGAGALLDLLEIGGVLWMIVAALAGTMLYAAAIPEAEPGFHQADHPPMWDILRQSQVLALFSACFSMSAAHGALYVFYSIFLSDHGYTKAAVGGLWSLGVLAEIAIFFFMSRLLRVFNLRTILLLSFSAAVLRFLMIGIGVELPVIIVIAQLLHGLTFGSFHAAAITAVNHWFPGRTRSRGQALYSSLTFGAGGLLGGLVSGWTWDHLGGGMTFVLSSFFALSGLLMVMAWIRGEDVVMRHTPTTV